MSIVCLSPSHNGFTSSGATLRTVGVSGAVTEVRNPVVALWELYKSAPLSKTMGKSCFGVQAPCPVAWSPAAPLRKPNICNPLTTSADHRCSWGRFESGVQGGRKKKKTRSHKNKHKQEYNSIHGLCLRSHSLNRTHWRRWFPSSSACCVDCMVLLPKVSRYINAQSARLSFSLSLVLMSLYHLVVRCLKLLKC